MTFSKKAVIFVFVQVVLFTAVCLVFSWYEKQVSDALIAAFFAWFGLEGGALAMIKVNKGKQSADLAALKKENTDLRKQLSKVQKAAGVSGQVRIKGA